MHAVGPSPVHETEQCRRNPTPPTSAPPKTGSRARQYLARARKTASGDETKVETRKPHLATAGSRAQEKSIAEANARKQTQQEVELAKAEAKDVADLKPKLHQKAIAPVKACAATEAMATARTEVDSKCAYTSDDAKHDAGIVNEADEQFVMAVESAAAAVEAAAVAAAGAREDCQHRKLKLDAITQSCDDRIRERADGCNIDDPVAKIRRLASLPIDELVARHEEEMAQMVDSVTKSAAAGAASAEITNASANSDISAVDTTGMIVEEYERDSGADAVVAPEPITPQGVHLSPANGGQDARDSALANVSANADMQCSKSEIEHAAPKIGAEGRKVWSDRANEEHDQEQVDHRWRGREGKPNTTAARHAKSRRRRENLKAQSNQYLYKQQVAHLDAVRQRMAEERARGYTERLEQWQRLEQRKRWLDEAEETNREFNATKNVIRGEHDPVQYRRAPPVAHVMWQAACTVLPRQNENGAAVTPSDSLRQRRAQHAASGPASDSDDCAEDANEKRGASVGVCRTMASNASVLQISAALLIAVACLLSSLSIAVPTVPGHIRVQGDAAARAAALHATMDSVASMLVPVPQISIILGCIALHGPGSYTERLRSRVIWVWAFLVALSGLADVAWYFRARHFDARKAQEQHILNLNRLLMVLMIALKILVIMLFVKAMPAPWVKLYRRCKHFLPCGKHDGGTHDFVHRTLALVWLHAVVGALLLSVALFASLGPVPWFPALQEPAVGVALVPLMFVKSATLFVSTGQAMSHIDIQGCFQPFGCLRCCRKQAYARELRRRRKRGFATPIVLLTRGWMKAVMRAKFFDVLVGLWLATAAVNSMMSLPGALEGIALPIVGTALLSCIAVDIHGLLLVWRLCQIYRAMHFRFDGDGDLNLTSSSHLEMPVTLCGAEDVSTEDKTRANRHCNDSTALWNGVSSENSVAAGLDLGAVGIDLPVESPLHPLSTRSNTWTWTRMYDKHGQPYVVHSESGRSVWESELPLEERNNVIESVSEVVAPAVSKAENNGDPARRVVHRDMNILQGRFHIDADDFHDDWQCYPVTVLFEVGVGAIPHVQRLNEHLCARRFWPVAHGVVAPYTKYYAAARRIHDRTGHTLLAEFIFNNLKHTLKATFKWTGRDGDSVEDMISQLELQDLCGSLAASQNLVSFTRFKETGHSRDP